MAPYSPNDGALSEVGNRVLMISFLLGMDHVISDLSLADSATDSFVMPFEEAVSFFKGRVPVTKKEWNTLEEKLRFRSFTVAKLESWDLVEKVRTNLIDAAETGKSLAETWGELEAKEVASPYYWETVYRTNIQTAYNAGRLMQIKKDPSDFLELIVIEDSRTTKNICLPLRGLVLPYNDPFWLTHWPPFHFNCRTTVRPIYGSKNVNITKESRTTAKGFAPQNGFGENPLDSGSFYKLTSAMLDRAIALDLKDDLATIAKSIGLASDPVATSKLVLGKNSIGTKFKASLGHDAHEKEFLKATEFLDSKVDSSTSSPVGDVFFSRKGNDHLITFTADPVKLQALKQLPLILKKMTGDIIPLRRPDKGYLSAYDGRVTINVDKIPQQFKVTLKKRSDGKWIVYDLNRFKMKNP